MIVGLLLRTDGEGIANTIGHLTHVVTHWPQIIDRLKGKKNKEIRAAKRESLNYAQEVHPI